METKYGEINSIEDFLEKLFEETGEGERILNPSADQHTQVIMIKVRCKLCGEIFERQSPRGALMSPEEGDGRELKEHIELHKTIEALNLT